MATSIPEGSRTFPPLLTMREAQDYLRVAKPTIYILAKGQLAPAVRRVGGHLRLDRDVLLRIIEGGAE